ncbi:unnamed protein product, partial [Rotaria sordida]
LPLYNSTSIVDNNNIKEEKIIFDQIQSDYKFEKNIQQQKQSFLILPDNEIEQMIIEQTNEEIIKDILEQIQKQISNDYLNQTNGIQIISTDIHNCIDSLLNHFDTNNNESISTINDVQMEDITRSLTEQTSMESDQQSSTLSQFDIIEPEESISTSHAHLCTCQCHQTTSNSVIINPTNEYILFERILQQTRQEEQEKQILNNNNRLLQTLKHQHQELMNFYQKQTNINKIDREQQTIHIGFCSQFKAFLSRPLPEHNSCDNTIARPQLSITHDNTIVRLTWNLPSTPMESIQNYEIYAYKQNVTTTSSDWKKIGTVKSMRLPMAVTLKEFQCNCHYAFAVRAISINNNTGPFCEPKTIFTGNTPIEPLNTSQILNLSL